MWVTDAGFAEVAAEMADELGGPPTLAEFLEVLGWSVPMNSDATDDTLTQPLRLTAKIAGGRAYRSDSPSRVGDLDDNVFEEAREHLNALAERAQAEDGAPVDGKRLAVAVLEELRGGRVILADVEPDDIRGLAVETPKKRVAKPKPGDVVAIPAAAGGYHVGVVLGRNRFGTALGLFAGTSPNGRVGRLRDTPRRHVYTEESLIKNGVWSIVDHDDSLRELFPADPPIYHRPNSTPGVDTGEFGAAETADGTLTPISQDEAREIGITDRTYRATAHAAFLQKQLDEGTAFTS
jgi:cell wall-associated NlpC family hydrolase